MKTKFKKIILLTFLLFAYVFLSAQSYATAISNNLSTTAKNKKAQELGIPIITEETFKQKFLTI